MEDSRAENEDSPLQSCNLGVIQAQLYLLNQHICFNDFHKHINYNLQSLQYFFGTLLSVIAEAIYEVNDSTF